jgi:hypothetical protein
LALQFNMRRILATLAVIARWVGDARPPINGSGKLCLLSQHCC